MGQRHLQELSDRKRFLTYLKYEYWRKKKKKRMADAGTQTLVLLILTDSEAGSFTAAPLRHMLT